jgi:hypothetical protein
VRYILLFLITFNVFAGADGDRYMKEIVTVFLVKNVAENKALKLSEEDGKNMLMAFEYFVDKKEPHQVMDGAKAFEKYCDKDVLKICPDAVLIKKAAEGYSWNSDARDEELKRIEKNREQTHFVNYISEGKYPEVAEQIHLRQVANVGGFQGCVEAAELKLINTLNFNILHMRDDIVDNEFYMYIGVEGFSKKDFVRKIASLHVHHDISELLEGVSRQFKKCGVPEEICSHAHLEFTCEFVKKYN